MKVLEIKAKIRKTFFSSISLTQFLDADVFMTSYASPPQVSSIENYMRLCTTQQDGTQWFGRSNITVIIILIWIIGCVASGLQYFYEVSFDYCKRKNNKDLLPIETGTSVQTKEN